LIYIFGGVRLPLIEN